MHKGKSKPTEQPEGEDTEKNSAEMGKDGKGGGTKGNAAMEKGS